MSLYAISWSTFTPQLLRAGIAPASSVINSATLVSDSSALLLSMFFLFCVCRCVYMCVCCVWVCVFYSATLVSDGSALLLSMCFLFLLMCAGVCLCITPANSIMYSATLNYDCMGSAQVRASSFAGVRVWRRRTWQLRCVFLFSFFSFFLLVFFIYKVKCFDWELLICFHFPQVSHNRIRILSLRSEWKHGIN